MELKSTQLKNIDQANFANQPVDQSLYAASPNELQKDQKHNSKMHKLKHNEVTNNPPTPHKLMM